MESGAEGFESDVVEILETNLDDVSSEIIGDTFERLLAAGALDVWTQAIQMKKNRPGVLLSVLCEAAVSEKLAALILTHTTAFGVRRLEAKRWKLRREIIRVNTPFGEIEIKCGYLGDRRVQASPEYESCRRAAELHGIPVRQVFLAASAVVAHD
jgi:uncharacterized protein (DUF111 family)